MKNQLEKKKVSIVSPLFLLPPDAISEISCFFEKPSEVINLISTCKHFHSLFHNENFFSCENIIFRYTLNFHRTDDYNSILKFVIRYPNCKLINQSVLTLPFVRIVSCKLIILFKVSENLEECAICSVINEFLLTNMLKFTHLKELKMYNGHSEQRHANDTRLHANDTRIIVNSNLQEIIENNIFQIVKAMKRLNIFNYEQNFEHSRNNIELKDFGSSTVEKLVIKHCGEFKSIDLKNFPKLKELKLCNIVYKICSKKYLLQHAIEDLVKNTEFLRNFHEDMILNVPKSLSKLVIDIDFKRTLPTRYAFVEYDLIFNRLFVTYVVYLLHKRLNSVSICINFRVSKVLEIEIINVYLQMLKRNISQLKNSLQEGSNKFDEVKIKLLTGRLGISPILKGSEIKNDFRECYSKNIVNVKELIDVMGEINLLSVCCENFSNPKTDFYLDHKCDKCDMFHLFCKKCKISCKSCNKKISCKNEILNCPKCKSSNCRRCFINCSNSNMIYNKNRYSACKSIFCKKCLTTKCNICKCKICDECGEQCCSICKNKTCNGCMSICKSKESDNSCNSCNSLFFIGDDSFSTYCEKHFKENLKCGSCKVFAIPQVHCAVCDKFACDDCYQGCFNDDCDTVICRSCYKNCFCSDCNIFGCNICLKGKKCTKCKVFLCERKGYCINKIGDDPNGECGNCRNNEKN